MKRPGNTQDEESRNDLEPPARVKVLRGSDPQGSELVGELGEKRPNASGELRKIDCPFLSTVNRLNMDFDFARVCAETNVRDNNIYACLVCNEYLLGKGKNTPLYAHALLNYHCLFICLTSGKVFCEPDDYEVLDVSLDDIKFNLHPKFDRVTIDELLDNPEEAPVRRSLSGLEYHPGIVGVNSINRCTDYINVSLQLLVKIKPLRDWLLLMQIRTDSQPGDVDIVVESMQKVVKKMFNYKSFKGMTSPHEFVHACHIRSGKQFTLLEKDDAHTFLLWLINYLVSSKTPGRTAIKQCLRGQVKVELDVPRTKLPAGGYKWDEELQCGTKRSDFFCLSLKIPPTPVFQEQAGSSEFHVFDLLVSNGYGLTVNNRRLNLLRLPEYLLIHYQRFTHNDFFIEKNNTTIKYPTKILDLTDYVDPESLDKNPRRTYSLIANIVHIGKAKEGKFVIYVRHGADQWFEIDDLRVTPAEPHRVISSPCYTQLWRLDQTPT